MNHQVECLELKNRAKGLLINIPGSSVVSYEVNFRAGEFLVPFDKWEVPHLMEHLVLGANKLIPKAKDFQAEIEKNGAYTNASTSYYYINYEAECAVFEWERLLDLFLVAISQPIFLEEEFKAEYGNVAEELAYRSNNNFRKLSIRMSQQFGLRTLSDKERLKAIKNINLADIKKHYLKTHKSANMRFVVAGDIKKNRQLILDKFEQFKLSGQGQHFAFPVEKPKKIDDLVYISNKTVENNFLYLDMYAPFRLTNDQFRGLALLNTILTDTLYSRILGTARERGLVYGMSSGINEFQDVSNWWFGVQVSQKNGIELMKLIYQELKRIKDGQIDDQDIESAKLYLIGSFYRSAQTVGSTASWYSNYFYFDDQLYDFNDYPKNIKKLTKKQLIEVARIMIEQNIWGLGMLGHSPKSFGQELKAIINPLFS